MSKSARYLAAALMMVFALPLPSPAQACKSLPEPARLCTVIPASAEVRDRPNGRVTYSASGKVWLAGHKNHGRWARIAVPCLGYEGWIASKNITCPAPVSAQETARSP